MEAAEGGSSSGPAPFLLKTYEMVDDASTDLIVSWSASMKSFVVWDTPQLSARLLPAYFKHNNFSSFIRQLNTYGFRKIDPERWEFANEDFVRGQKHLLRNIRRRKPIHSHSNSPGGGGMADPERTALAEEIDRLKREKSSLQATLLRFEQQRSGTQDELVGVEQRLADMEKRQLKMIAFLQLAMRNPQFVESLKKMAASSSIDFSVIHKKRRLPSDPDCCQDSLGNNLCDDHCSTSKLEFGQVLNQDFCDKLKLELRSALSDSGLSDDDTGSSHRKQIDCGHDAMECSLVPETMELCDTGESTCPTKNLLGDDGITPCHLSLTLASSGMKINRTDYASRTPNAADQGDATSMELDKFVKSRENDELSALALDSGHPDAEDATVQEAPRTSDETPVNPPVRVNDVFWEQFLTERPGSSDNKEVIWEPHGGQHKDRG